MALVGTRAARLVLVLALGAQVVGCSLLTPLPRESTLAERLAVIPTQGAPVEAEVRIYWDDHQIPFIEAKSDTDLAAALGMVHAHLRLGQMALMRRIAEGRIAESVGPPATDIDHALRILNFGRAAEKMEASLPAETRAWLEAYARGVNHYQQNVEKLPQEYAVLGLAREPWTVRDLLTVGRLAGTDVNWLVWFRLLRLRRRPDWPLLWARLSKNGGSSVASFRGGKQLSRLDGLLAGFSRSGSNSLVLAPGKSASGAALMANDPHLGIMLPNLWLIAGYKSPSYHAVGLMIPGVPFMAVGRNPRIAWGGTNMRAAVSDLYDVSKLAPTAFTERTERIRVRWWFDRTITVRETAFGPVLSDAPFLKTDGGRPFAMKWLGHEVSDEYTAMLKVNRARNWKEFRAAYKTFSVSGQNMLYADVDGNIGQVLAVRLPVRAQKLPPDIVLDPDDPKSRWRGTVDSTDLPAIYNPKRGFLASANNRPVEMKLPVGYFFSPDDRVERLRELLGKRGKWSRDDLGALQRDVYMSSAVRLRDRLVAAIDEFGLAKTADDKTRELIRRLRGWDGEYGRESIGAVAFERLRDHFSRVFYQRQFGADAPNYMAMGRIKTLMIEDMDRAARPALETDLRQALADAAERIDTFKNWGDMHRLALSHPLARLPLIGGRYRFTDLPVAGSTDTIMKTSHGATDQRHATSYGSNARHISDMSDMDENYFVLLGGQDGWFRGSTFMDQVKPWRAGEYVRLPLRLESVRESFRHLTILSPGSGGG